MNKETYRKNGIIKDLDLILRKIDTRVNWTDYIPSELLSVNKDIVAIGFTDGRVKYIDVTGEKPAFLVRSVCNALDDYCVEQQFMSEKQLYTIKDDIHALVKERIKITDTAIELLSKEKGGAILSDEECLEIYDISQALEIVPASFPANSVQEKDARNVLIDFLHTDNATFLDAFLLLQTIEEHFLKEAKKMILMGEDYLGDRTLEYVSERMQVEIEKYHAFLPEYQELEID